MRYSRQSKILELIEKYEVETQDKLASLLKEYGYDVTQATISRDIKREFDTSFSIAKTRHIEITPLAVNFFVKFYDFVSACWCLL